MGVNDAFRSSSEARATAKKYGAPNIEYREASKSKMDRIKEFYGKTKAGYKKAKKSYKKLEKEVGAFNKELDAVFPREKKKKKAKPLEFF